MSLATEPEHRMGEYEMWTTADCRSQAGRIHWVAVYGALLGVEGNTWFEGNIYCGNIGIMKKWKPLLYDRVYVGVLARILVGWR